MTQNKSENLEEKLEPDRRRQMPHLGETVRVKYNGGDIKSYPAYPKLLTDIFEGKYVNIDDVWVYVGDKNDNKPIQYGQNRP